MFKIGDTVSYGLHGKCIITAIETKELSSGVQSFYQIKILRSSFGSKNSHRGTHSESIILIPTETAELKGLRPLMSREQAETVLKILADSDYHFELNMTWVSKQKMLEETIRKEGAIGLAKAVGHLYVLLKQDAVPPVEISRFYENAYRVLAKELAESLQLTAKEIEPLISKALKNKLSFHN